MKKYDISRNTLSNWVKRGYIKVEKTLSGRYIYIIEDKIDKNKTVTIDCVERCIEFFQDNRPLIKGEKNRVQD